MHRLIAQTNSSLEALNPNDLGISNSHAVSMLYLQLALGFKKQAQSNEQQVDSICHVKPKTKPNRLD